MQSARGRGRALNCWLLLIGERSGDSGTSGQETLDLAGVRFAGVGHLAEADRRHNDSLKSSRDASSASMSLLSVVHASKSSSATATGGRCWYCTQGTV
jgi:hypothetical protein